MKLSINFQSQKIPERILINLESIFPNWKYQNFSKCIFRVFFRESLIVPKKALFENNFDSQRGTLRPNENFSRNFAQCLKNGRSFPQLLKKRSLAPQDKIFNEGSLETRKTFFSQKTSKKCVKTFRKRLIFFGKNIFDSSVSRIVPKNLKWPSMLAKHFVFS